jgi:geranylgeranyl diphosphate synthase type II
MEGKRTLMLIHLMGACSEGEHSELVEFLSVPITKRSLETASMILEWMQRYESIEHAKITAKYLAGAALKEFYTIFSRLPESRDKTLIESIILYMINREY